MPSHHLTQWGRILCIRAVWIFRVKLWHCWNRGGLANPPTPHPNAVSKDLHIKWPSLTGHLAGGGIDSGLNNAQLDALDFAAKLIRNARCPQGLAAKIALPIMALTSSRNTGAAQTLAFHVVAAALPNSQLRRGIVFKTLGDDVPRPTAIIIATFLSTAATIGVTGAKIRANQFTGIKWSFLTPAQQLHLEASFTDAL